MAKQPEGLTAQLGEAAAAWESCRADVAGRAEVTSEWKFYGEKYGWQCKLVAHGRALAYLIPKDGCFVVASALRAPAIEALREAGYPAAKLREIEAAREAPEGKPARIEVHGVRDLPIVKTLLDTKLAQKPAKSAKSAKRPKPRRRAS
jgi:hypothetical protein